MGEVHEKLSRLRSEYAGLTTQEKQEYRLAVAEVVQRRFPTYSNAEAWQAFLDAPLKQKQKVLQRAGFDHQVKALRGALQGRIPYQRVIRGVVVRVISARLIVVNQEVLRLQLEMRFEKNGQDVTPPEIGPGEYVNYDNPRMFVPDPLGELEERFTDPLGNEVVLKFTENPLRALRHMVADTARMLIKKHNL